MPPVRLSIIACVLCVAASSADAQLYKWIDENGGVNYGDWPPSGVKLQPMNRGTVSSVADRALVPTATPAMNAPRSPAPRPSAPGISVRNEAPPSSAPSSTDDADIAGTYASYYGYPQRPAAVVAEGERRLGNTPVVKPLLPIHPAIPDLALPQRR